MLFDFDVTIPAGTQQLTPFEQTFKLTRGKLSQISVLFPPGPATLVYVVIRHGLHQLMPANFDGTLNFDDMIITSLLNYAMVDSPYELTVLGWSPLAVYDHNITLHFNVEPTDDDNWDDFNRMVFLLNDKRRDR